MFKLLLKWDLEINTYQLDVEKYEHEIKWKH